RCIRSPRCTTSDSYKPTLLGCPDCASRGPSCCLPPARPNSGICPLSLHDALPIFTIAIASVLEGLHAADLVHGDLRPSRVRLAADRKSTRLNSSHGTISYAVFCSNKKIDPKRTVHVT